MSIRIKYTFDYLQQPGVSLGQNVLEMCCMHIYHKNSLSLRYSELDLQERWLFREGDLFRSPENTLQKDLRNALKSKYDLEHGY